jgi:hypothetical protein
VAPSAMPFSPSVFESAGPSLVSVPVQRGLPLPALAATQVMPLKLAEAEKVPPTDVIFSWHHQDRAMVLFTKVYGELSLRIQQSLRRCNNRGEFTRMQQRPSVKKLR